MPGPDCQPDLHDWKISASGRIQSRSLSELTAPAGVPPDSVVPAGLAGTRVRHEEGTVGHVA